MVDILQAIILGLVQGATEFLPVSSSGHLVLVPWLLGWEKGSLTFDTTVHLGTLLAVVIYFREDVMRIVLGVLETLKTRSLDNPDGKLGWLIALGCVPGVVIGLLFKDVFEGLFATPAYAASFLLVTGLILLLSEQASKKGRELSSIGVSDSLLIGVAQAAAITPGISRSGATIAAGLALGIKRETAARFSFLLSLPIIFGAWLVGLADAFEVGVSSNELIVLGVGFVTAAVSGYACIHFLISYLRERNLYVFTAYCWIFGLFCLGVGSLTDR